MEHHFEARGCAGSGRAMMTATAALQVNLDAGPARAGARGSPCFARWCRCWSPRRPPRPTSVAGSSGWHSMRQETWHGIDHARSDPVTGGDPSVAWALYALDAPVMLLRDGDGRRPRSPSRVTFARVAARARRPSAAPRPGPTSTTT